VTELEAVTGVGPAAAKKLREAFVTTAELLAVQNPIELQSKTKLGEGTVTNIIRSAREMIGLFGFRSGLQVEQDMANKPRLKTGIEAVDKALLGGFEAGSIVEFFGPARGGKTQWCSYLAVRAQLPEEEGGLGGRVLWLDSESSFKPWIIRANALRFGLDPDVALGNIGRAHIILAGQMMDIFNNIPRLCSEQDYKLVIVDSFSGLFRAEYLGLENLKVRQQDMNSLLNLMRRAGTATGAVFVYSNQVGANINPYGGGGVIPVGGHILSHGSDYRFYTRRKKDDIRILQLHDNAGVPEFKQDVHLGWGGFYPDAKTKKVQEQEIVAYFEEHGWGAALDRIKAAQTGDEEESEEEKEEEVKAAARKKK
jgi:DNA repair protein RadA